MAAQETSDSQSKPLAPTAAPQAAADFHMQIISRFVAGVFSPDENATWRDHIRRLGLGAAGSLFYAGIKNVTAARIGIVGLLTMDPHSPERSQLFFGYCFAAFAVASAGAVPAWLSAQKSGRLLFIIGMFGFQILVTVVPGLQSKNSLSKGSLFDGSMLEKFFQITPAYADASDKCVGDTAFAKGFKAFFGVRDQYDKFAVVVASGKNQDDAQAKLKAIGAKNPDLKLHLGSRSCDSDYYPVFASDWLPLEDAKSLLEKIQKSSGISDAFLSPGPAKY